MNKTTCNEETSEEVLSPKADEDKQLNSEIEIFINIMRTITKEKPEFIAQMLTPFVEHNSSNKHYDLEKNVICSIQDIQPQYMRLKTNEKIAILLNKIEIESTVEIFQYMNKKDLIEIFRHMVSTKELENKTIYSILEEGSVKNLL